MTAMLRLVVLAALAACSSAPRCEVAKPAAKGQPFLWRVQKADGPVVWLYGTIHDYGLDAVPKDALVALDASPHFLSELGDTTPDPDKFRELVRIKSGKSLDQLLPADRWWDLRDALAGVAKEDDLRRYRPWYAMSLLTSTMAPPPKPSMDFALAERARDRKIAVEQLENWDEQLAALDAAVKITDLVETIRVRGEIRCEVARVLAAYDAGDLDAMGRLLPGDKSAGLLDARNAKWLPAIERYLENGGAFVAVGVSHMAGDAGLPAVLERAGYTVTRSGTPGSPPARTTRPATDPRTRAIARRRDTCAASS
jgi:uncharacterized protein YbaP (TraB family)